MAPCSLCGLNSSTRAGLSPDPVDDAHADPDPPSLGKVLITGREAAFLLRDQGPTREHARLLLRAWLADRRVTQTL